MPSSAIERGSSSWSSSFSTAAIRLATFSSTVSPSISIESHPAWPDARPDDYTVPYLTTVRFWLPLYSFKGRS